MRAGGSIRRRWTRSMQRWRCSDRWGTRSGRAAADRHRRLSLDLGDTRAALKSGARPPALRGGGAGGGSHGRPPALGRDLPRHGRRRAGAEPARAGPRPRREAGHRPLEGRRPPPHRGGPPRPRPASRGPGVPRALAGPAALAGGREAQGARPWPTSARPASSSGSTPPPRATSGPRWPSAARGATGWRRRAPCWAWPAPRAGSATSSPPGRTSSARWRSSSRSARTWTTAACACPTSRPSSATTSSTWTCSIGPPRPPPRTGPGRGRLRGERAGAGSLPDRQPAESGSTWQWARPRPGEREQQARRAFETGGAPAAAPAAAGPGRPRRLAEEYRELEDRYNRPGRDPEPQSSLRRSRPPPAPPAREIQTRVLDAETLLLEYALGDERSYLWAISSRDHASYVVGPSGGHRTGGTAVYAP